MLIFINRVRAAAALALVAVLAGCGGGGSDSEQAAPIATPIDTTATTPSAFVDTVPPQLVVAAPAYADSERVAAFNALNEARVSAGLGAMAQDAQLDQAAQAHAIYNSLNHNVGHFEGAGQPGFTGNAPWERSATAGWNGSTTEVASSSGGPMRAAAMIQLLLGSPYHLMAMMNFEPTRMGVGYSTSPYPWNLVVDFGSRTGQQQGAPSTTSVQWPVAGATGVPVSSCCESPDPMPGINVWGYPVSLQVHERKKLTVTNFALTDAGGGMVATRLLSFATDPNLQSRNSTYFAAIVPYAPLAANSTYTAVFAGAIDGTPYSKTWSFTTGAQ